MNMALAPYDNHPVEYLDQVYGIMKCLLRQETDPSPEQTFLWIIGLDHAGSILFIELLATEIADWAEVEPIPIYRVAVLKEATRVALVQSRVGDDLQPTEAQLDVTDRLIQAGRLLNIALVDHLVMNAEHYLSFAQEGIMAKLAQSLKYVSVHEAAQWQAEAKV